MAGRLENKVAIVSGGARGLGGAIVEVFAAEGARVVVADVLVNEGEALAAELRGAGHEVAFRQADVSNADDWRGLVATTIETFGSLTTLVNNAGIYLAGGLEEETADSWDRMIAVDQTGVFLGMQTSMPALEASGNGSVVNISSVAAILGSVRAFGYHAAKGAVLSMTSAAAVEYAQRNVRINTVLPGRIEAPSHALTRPQDSMAARVPMGRKGEPRDIAYACLYLCSDEANYVTGVQLHIDGGMTAA
ncbi:glucose 1-dehydrogenase [Actinomadura madurae]|uniref:SDR family NAD(P)-dependent oxidoreductase n=1 Tax=Actinomadura madurae TaxID=1993 RepID=UPI00399A076C